MSRALYLTFAIFVVSAVFSMMVATGIFPNNFMATVAGSNLNQSAISSMATQATVTDATSSGGYIGFFNIGMEIIQSLFTIVLGTFLVAIPLTQIGVPLVFAGFIQLILFGLLAIDLYTIWGRGTW